MLQVHLYNTVFKVYLLVFTDTQYNVAGSPVQYDVSRSPVVFANTQYNVAGSPVQYNVSRSPVVFTGTQYNVAGSPVQYDVSRSPVVFTGTQSGMWVSRPGLGLEADQNHFLRSWSWSWSRRVVWSKT